MNKIPFHEFFTEQVEKIRVSKQQKKHILFALFYVHLGIYAIVLTAFLLQKIFA